jgi:hypothetical protein
MSRFVKQFIAWFRYDLADFRCSPPDPLSNRFFFSAPFFACLKGGVVLSPALLQAGNQRDGQAGLHHFVLGDFNIVRDTVKPDNPAFGLIDGIAGPRVAVAGLSHAAGIDNKPVFAQHYPDAGRKWHRQAVVILFFENRRYMRMTDQTEF